MGPPCLLISCLIKGPLFFRLLLFQWHGRSPGRGQGVNSRQLCLHLFFFPLRWAPHKGTVSPAAQPGAPYCVAPFELIMFRGWVVIGGGGRGWLGSFVSCQQGSNLVCAICLYPEEGWRLHSTAALVLSLPACQSVCVYRSLSLPRSLSLSHSFPLGSVLRSASLHTAWPSSLFTLPAKWSLSGLSIWLISVILPAFSWKKRTWSFNLMGKSRKGLLLPVCLLLRIFDMLQFVVVWKSRGDFQCSLFNLLDSKQVSWSLH